MAAPSFLKDRKRPAHPNELLAAVRNAIAHGRRPTKRELRHGRHWQLWIGEYRLRQAIKEVVAQHGHPLVLVAPIEAELQQVAADLETAHGMDARYIASDLEQPDAGQR